MSQRDIIEVLKDKKDGVHMTELRQLIKLKKGKSLNSSSINQNMRNLIPNFVIRYYPPDTKENQPRYILRKNATKEHLSRQNIYY